jgi:hypothetical protein
MKQLLLFTFVCIPFLIFAQIIVQPTTLPQVGDTLRTAVDNLPSNISLNPIGANQRWDFTSLQAPFTRQTIVKPAAEGAHAANFRLATMLIQLSDNAEIYYRSTGTTFQSTFQLVGIYGKDPVGFGIDVMTRFSPPAVERRAPLRYKDNNHVESNILLPFSADDLPDFVLDQLPITPDSLRIRLAISRRDIVDAWGKITIPGGIYDVLREKRTEIRDTRVDAKLGFFPWQDITGLIPGSDLIGKDTTVSYYFLSNESKEPIAIVTMDRDEKRAIRVEYKADNNDLMTDVQNVKSLKPGVYAFPNPAIVNVRFEFSNLPPGNYKLTLYNILGAPVWSQRYYINGQRIEKVDISDLRKGTYLYSLQDDNGKTIATKRLVVVRP